jgi:PAS domain S-box-containing protein
MDRYSTEPAVPSVAGAAKHRHGIEFFSPPVPAQPLRQDPTRWLLFAGVAALFGMVLWAALDLSQAWSGSPQNLVLPRSWCLGLGLAALVAVGGAMLRYRRTAAENARLNATNTRLCQERDLLWTVVDTLPDNIYAKDLQGRFLFNNPAHARDLGAPSPAAMRGKSDHDFFPGELAGQFFADEQKIITTGDAVINQEQYKVRPGAPVGEKFWSLSSKVLWRGRDGEILGTVGVTRDIHEFKQTQEALRKSEQRLREVLRRTRCILNSGMVEGGERWRERALDANSPFYWDFPVQNLEGAQEVFPLDVPPGKSYQQVWSESRPPEDSAAMKLLSANAFLQGLPYYRTEFRCTDRHGVEHWMQQFVTVEKLTPNRWQIFGITTDITELKHSEHALRASGEQLRRFAAHLEQSNRELQDFAFVASHDLQEPLRKIVVFGDRMRDKCGGILTAEARDYLERMQKAATRMQTLISDLLAFSRLTTKASPFIAVNLADVLLGVLEDLEGRIEQVQGRVESGDLPVIEADGLQMRQLLQNLIGNALKFRRPETPPVVAVNARKHWQNGVELCELTVSDNGIGFDEIYLDRIFNVFQRLHSHDEYEGTGMGLAIVRKIVLHHGGHVTARSQPGCGATFIVTLPAAHSKSVESPLEMTKA